MIGPNEPVHFVVEGSVLAHGRPSTHLYGRGVGVWDQSQLWMTASAIVANREVGLVVGGAGSLAVLSNSVVRDTLPSANDSWGRGVHVQEGARIELDQTLVSGNFEVGLTVANPGSVGRMVGGAVVDGRPRKLDGRFGVGVASLPQSQLQLSGVRLAGHPQTALLVSGAAASVERCVFSSSAVALHPQDGVLLSEVAVLPAALGPLELLVTQDTRFEGNAVRLGSGIMPLPEPFTP